MGMILRIASSRIVGQGDIVGRSGYFSLNLSANSVMRGRLDARRTLKSLVADLRLIFRNWVKQVCQEVKGVVAIDGKLMRGPSQCDGEHTRGKEGFKLWMVSAWSAANGISLGQVKVDDKSSEITAIPLLINSLELSGCIVTIDAMGCQKDITQTIIGHDANYIIAIKENKKKKYQPAKQIIDDYQDRDEIINRVIRHVSEKCRTWKD